MREFAALVATIAVFAILFGPAAGLLGASPAAKPQTTDVNAICVYSFATATAAGGAQEPPDRLDETIRACASLEDWLAGARAYPDATGGVDPRTFVARRCRDGAARLARYATCRDLGDAKRPALGSVVVTAP